jgi:hypothetical protein
MFRLVNLLRQTEMLHQADLLHLTEVFHLTAAVQVEVYRQTEAQRQLKVRLAHQAEVFLQAEVLLRLVRQADLLRQVAVVIEEIKMKSILNKTWVMFLMSITLNSYAQNEADAFQFSQESINGSARFNALGGAFTALGGDISGVYYNPAGAGVFTKSEWSVSLALHSNLSSADFLGNQTIGGKSNGNIPTLGFVAVQKDMSGKWRNGAFSFYLNRANTFQRSFNYQGNGSNTSVLDTYLNTLEANGTTPSALSDSENPAYPYDIYLAWNNYLIDVDTVNGNYFTATGLDPIGQSYQQNVSGAKRETAISYGANYDDKLYVGAGLIFSRIVFDKKTTYTESTPTGDTTTYLNDFIYKFNENTSGLGVALNLGLIYRPTKSVRLGASVKTPTRYNLDITYSSSNVANFETTTLSTLSPFVGEYNYTMRTPLRANVGAAYLFGKLGLVSVDAEMVDYSGTQLVKGTDGYQFSTENKALNTSLNTSYNVRVGAEYRITSFWIARAGYANYMNPYKTSVDDNAGFQIYSLGAGYRNEDFFVDASYQIKMSEAVHYAYDQSYANRAKINFQDHFITVTAGYRF